MDCFFYDGVKVKEYLVEPFFLFIYLFILILNESSSALVFY